MLIIFFCTFWPFVFLLLLFFFVCLLFCFLGPLPWHIEAPRLGVESELQLPAYTTGYAGSKRVCDLHHSSWQRWILDPLSEARDGTHSLVVSSRICFCCATMGTPIFGLFRATPTAYGVSQAWGQIRAAAASLHHSHSNWGSKLHL